MSESTTLQTSLSSVELNRHKDGTYYWTIKLYFEDETPLVKVLADIGRIDSALALQYGPRTRS